MATKSNDAYNEAELHKLIALKKRHDEQSAALNAKIAAKMRASSHSSSLPKCDVRSVNTTQMRSVPRIYGNHEAISTREQHSVSILTVNSLLLSIYHFHHHHHDLHLRL